MSNNLENKQEVLQKKRDTKDFEKIIKQLNDENNELKKKILELEKLLENQKKSTFNVNPKFLNLIGKNLILKDEKTIYKLGNCIGYNFDNIPLYFVYNEFDKKIVNEDEIELFI